MFVWKLIYSKPPALEPAILPKGSLCGLGYWCGIRYKYFDSKSQAVKKFNLEVDEQIELLKSLKMAAQEDEQ